jgi:hypothetical protein
MLDDGPTGFWMHFGGLRVSQYVYELKSSGCRRILRYALCRQPSQLSLLQSIFGVYLAPIRNSMQKPIEGEGLLEFKMVVYQEVVAIKWVTPVRMYWIAIAAIKSAITRAITSAPVLPKNR